MKYENNSCEACGIVQQGGLTFAIGAKADNDTANWCVVEGTGRFVCPACFPAERERARQLVDGLVRQDGRP
jgi:hypothetical protein